LSVAVCKVTEDAIFVGADSNISYGSCSKDSALGLKVFEAADMIGAGTGEGEAVQLFKFFLNQLEWEYTDANEVNEDVVLTVYQLFVETVDKMGYNLRDQNDETHSYFFVVVRGKAFAIRGYHVREITDFDAIGCGDDVAKAIMRFGGSPEQAMDMTCVYNAHCDYPLTVYRYDKFTGLITWTVYNKGDILPE
jgi:hypothetical protein